MCAQANDRIVHQHDAALVYVSAPQFDHDRYD